MTPGLVLMICSAGRRVSAVEWMAPETMPSAAFFFIIMVPKNVSSFMVASAFSGVMPLALRSS